jgi:hypothetical protein
MSTTLAHPGRLPILTALSVHVFPETSLRVRLHPDEDRAVVIVGDTLDCPTLLNLFVDRAELVVLRDRLTAAVTDLDTAQREDPCTTEPSAQDAQDSAHDTVRDPAA